jgi:5-methylcytosine-specific restriction endonuclease McrA
MHDEKRLLLTGQKEANLARDSRPLAAVSDDDLLRRLAAILAQSRRVEAELVAHIAEVDERRLYAREAVPSMFAYCTEALHLSESEAYRRIAVARASRGHPMLLAMLGDGRLHLSGIAQLAPHLTTENRERLLRRATHRSKRQIEELIAELAPREDVPTLMRRLPERSAAPATGSLPSAPNPPTLSGMCAPKPPTLSGMGRTVTRSPDSPPPSSIPSLPRPAIQPLSPGRYKVQFTAGARLHEKLERLRALMRSQFPDGDLGAIIESAVTEKLDRLEARRFGRRKAGRENPAPDSRPSSGTQPQGTRTPRHVPAAVRRAVYERDGGQCRFVDEMGRRCPARARLEYHHLHPFGLGGDHRPENIHLVCRAHNAYLAERDYGRAAMARFRREARRTSGPPALVPPGTGSRRLEAVAGPARASAKALLLELAVEVVRDSWTRG